MIISINVKVVEICEIAYCRIKHTELRIWREFGNCTLRTSGHILMIFNMIEHNTFCKFSGSEKSKLLLC